MEDITDANYEHAKKIWKEFKIKILVNTMICMFKAIRYYFQRYMKTLETNVFKYLNLILLIFNCTRISIASLLEKD